MAERPRVVHLTTVHHPLDPRIFYKQVQSLRRAGFDVHLVAQHARSETVDGVPITALSRTSGRYRRLLRLREGVSQPPSPSRPISTTSTTPN